MDPAFLRRAVQLSIITVDHFAPQVDGVRLSLLQFLVVAVESTAAALLFENPTLAEFGANSLRWPTAA